MKQRIFYNLIRLPISDPDSKQNLGRWNLMIFGNFINYLILKQIFSLFITSPVNSTKGHKRRNCYAIFNVMGYKIILSWLSWNRFKKNEKKLLEKLHYNNERAGRYQDCCKLRCFHYKLRKARMKAGHHHSYENNFENRYETQIIMFSEFFRALSHIYFAQSF